MRYNEKYDVYIDDDLVIYYLDKKKDKLMQRKFYKDKDGYFLVYTKIGTRGVHRIIYETFVGEIPDGYEIDHIKGNKTDNRPEMLQLVTHKENMNNSITRERLSNALKGNTCAKGHIGTTNNKGKTFSEFGRKFKEHYGISRHQNIKLYNKECLWYNRHKNKCRWE